jgi:uncharacterized protein YbjT (DUF2867 family)
MIVVMGAAGHVGSKTADLLLRRGQEVRVFEHHRSLKELRERGAEVVTGDARNLEDLRKLFQEADAALVLVPEDVTDARFAATRSAIARTLAEALREQPVRHVVVLSAAGVDRGDVAGPPVGLRELERRLFELEDSHVLALRSALYMDYLLAGLPLIRSRRVNGSAVDGDLRLPMIATRDVAREAVDRLARRDFTGHQGKLLLGPEDVSMREATHLIGSILGLTGVSYVQLPPGDVKDALLDGGMSDEAASLLVEMQLAVNDGRPFAGVRRTSDATRPTRLEEFLRGALSADGSDQAEAERGVRR